MARALGCPWLSKAAAASSTDYTMLRIRKQLKMSTNDKPSVCLILSHLRKAGFYFVWVFGFFLGFFFFFLEHSKDVREELSLKKKAKVPGSSGARL